MNDYVFARLVISKSGHDKGRVYIIVKSDKDYVYLTDGKLRKLDKLKRKNIKHIQLTNFISEEIIKLNKNNKLHDEDVKRVIKEYEKKHFHCA